MSKNIEYRTAQLNRLILSDGGAIMQSRGGELGRTNWLPITADEFDKIRAILEGSADVSQQHQAP